MSWWIPNKSLQALLHQVLANQAQGERTMSAISDAVATAKTKLDNEGVQLGLLIGLVTTLNQELKDALANAADADAAVAAVTALSAEMDAQVQQIQGANPPPPAA